MLEDQSLGLVVELVGVDDARAQAVAFRELVRPHLLRGVVPLVLDRPVLLSPMLEAGMVALSLGLILQGGPCLSGPWADAL